VVKFGCVVEQLFGVFFVLEYTVIIAVHTVSQKHYATIIHAFIILTIVSRFSKRFHCCILYEIFNKIYTSIFHHTLYVSLHYVAKYTVKQKTTALFYFCNNFVKFYYV